MAEQKKILVSLDKAFLSELDAYLKTIAMSRSEFVRRAMRFYMQENRRELIRLAMEDGYQEMGKINLEIANACFHADSEAIIRYEENLR